MKKIKYSIGEASARELRILIRYVRELLGIDPGRVLEGKLYKYCFENICFLTKRSIEPPEGFNMIYSGECVGLIYRSRVFPSPQLYERAFKLIGGYRAAIVLSEHGVRSFLYGNDVFASSITEYYEPIDNIVAVIDYSDRRVIGVAEPMLRGRALREAIKKCVEKPVYRNLFDLGIFLRGFF